MIKTFWNDVSIYYMKDEDDRFIPIIPIYMVFDLMERKYLCWKFQGDIPKEEIRDLSMAYLRRYFGDNHPVSEVIDKYVYPKDSFVILSEKELYTKEQVEAMSDLLTRG